MLFFAIIAAAVFVYLLQYFVYKKYAFHALRYQVTLQLPEVFEGDELYLYEEIENRKWLPMPFIKVDAELPEGLAFVITDSGRTTYPRVIRSMFVLRGQEMIRRRWKIRCMTRGSYTLGRVTLQASDILGFHIQAKVIAPERKHGSDLVVLPKAISLEREFTSSRYQSGDHITRRSLLTDPLYRAGIREYAPGDPMNRIHWKKTAAIGALMVNVEEYTDRFAFQIVLNMQSKDHEKTIPGPPSAPMLTEACVTVAASILDAVSSERIPVRIISNTEPSRVMYGAGTPYVMSEDAEADPVGAKIFVSPAYRGQNDMITALRMLACMEAYTSIPVEKMLDHIAANPYAYANGGNIVFVSAFLSDRMIHLARLLRQQGIHISFYITGTINNALIIPDDVEVHFKTYLEKDA